MLSYYTVVYGKSARQERSALWVSLLNMIPMIGDSPWIIGGDFNAISNMAVYSGKSMPDVNSIQEFSGFINDSGLIDLQTTGCCYTWTGMRSNRRV